MFETASIAGDSILKDAREMRKRTEEVLPAIKESTWRKIQRDIEIAANDGLFECRILDNHYQPLSYKEIVTTLKSKGYRVKFSRYDYRNKFVLHVYWN